TVARALANLVKHQCNGNTLQRILYFHVVRADSLLYDVVIELILPRWSRGAVNIDVRGIEVALRKWIEEGKTSGVWSDYTIRRVAQGVLSTLRDFGVLQGAVNKRIGPAYLSVQAFAYIAFYLEQHRPLGKKLVDLIDWSIFFLPREGVERFFLEAHQHGLLEYHVAGSVTRLTFPATTLEEYTNVLTR
ncbi:MAG: BrxA family protein, partial [Methanobacteriota archaeon]